MLSACKFLSRKFANKYPFCLFVFLNLSQNPHKFFPDERFGDESPLLTMRQSGRCRVNSTPTAETMFTDLDSFVAFHPPLPPPPPPYHPPATPIHNQLKAGWKQRHPSQHPSRSFSYPCNHSLFHSRTAPKAGPPPVYLPGVKAAAPDCTNATGLGRQTVAAAAATAPSAAVACEKQVVSQHFANLPKIKCSWNIRSNFPDPGNPTGTQQHPAVLPTS